MAFIQQRTLWVAFNPEIKHLAKPMELQNHITFFCHDTGATEICVQQTYAKSYD